MKINQKNKKLKKSIYKNQANIIIICYLIAQLDQSVRKGLHRVKLAAFLADCIKQN